MTNWEAGTTAQTGPASLIPRPRPAPDPLRGAAVGTDPWWMDTMDAVIRTCHAHGRPDLAERLARRRARLLHPQLRVLVAGTAQQGRSRLVNALINAPVCGLLPDTDAVVPTVVHHADTPTAHLIRRESAAADWTAAVGLQARIPLVPDRLAASLAEATAALPGDAPVHVDIGVPRSLLAGGLVLIDAPALSPAAGDDAVAAARDLADRAGADLVLYACEAGRQLSDAELTVLAGLGQIFPGLVVVLTKADYAADWRRDVAENRIRLNRAGIPAAVAAVSSSLRLHAVRTGDETLNRESGFTDLLVHLRQMAGAKPDRLARATAGALGRLALQELAAPLRAELENQDAAGSSDAAANLQATHRRLDDLRKCTVRWQNRLSDEVADLMSDIEHDLRERVKALLAEADEFFATNDPAKTWDEFESWLRDALRDLAQTSMTGLAERTEWMAHRTAGMFPPEAGNVLPPTALAITDGNSLSGVSTLDAPPVATFTPGQKLFIGLRGSYGGVVMFGLATSLAGMSLINPISIGGGALFGGKSVRDESKTLLKRRQTEARNAVRQHVDDIFTKLNKDARDSVRQAQRALRDHFTAVTEDLQEDAMESLRNAKAAADRDAAAREARNRRVREELTRLAELHAQAQALTERARA
ncbi:GTP-binding protein [Actinoplanes sp. NPDC023801]|uniref:GTP-binding protein n=1 Tax=Actinoplanes sp. NPDC023801 TaxID=3154595 RepID=UPI0033F64657